MTCKDCVHFGVCRFSYDVNGAIDIYNTFVHKNTYQKAEAHCQDFKDKSRFIELSVKIGDTVYQIEIGRTIAKRQVRNFYISEYGLHYVFWIDGYGEYITDADEVIFLTPEAAEKALERIKNNDLRRC